MESTKWTSWGFSSTLKGNDLRSYADIMETNDMAFLNGQAKVLWIGNVPESEFADIIKFFEPMSPLVFTNTCIVDHLVFNGLVNPHLIRHVVNRKNGAVMRRFRTIEFFETTFGDNLLDADVRAICRFTEIANPVTLVIDNIKDDLGEISESGQNWRGFFDSWLDSVKIVRINDSRRNPDRGFMFFLARVARACNKVQKFRLLCELPLVMSSVSTVNAKRSFDRMCSRFLESLLSRKNMIALRLPAWAISRVISLGNFGSTIPQMFEMSEFTTLKLCLYWKRGDTARVDLSASGKPFRHPIRTIVLRHIHFEDVINDTSFEQGGVLPATLKYKISSLRLLQSSEIKQQLVQHVAKYSMKEKITVVTIHRKDSHYVPAVWNVSNQTATRIKGFGHTDGNNLYDSDNPPPSQYE